MIGNRNRPPSSLVALFIFFMMAALSISDTHKNSQAHSLRKGSNQELTMPCQEIRQVERWRQGTDVCTQRREGAREKTEWKQNVYVCAPGVSPDF